MDKNAFPKTRYDNCTPQELYRMFSQDRFFHLSDSQKLDLLQAVVNEQCRREGMQPCTVSFESLGGGVSGYNSENQIILDRDMVCHQCRVDQIELPNGTRKEHVTVLEDANFQTLETTLHEWRHAYQNAVVNGQIGGAEGEKKIFAANTFSETPVKNGTEKGCQYLEGLDPQYGYELYFLNPTELDAFRDSQTKMREILKNLPQDYSKTVYLDNLRENGWEAQLAEAQGMFGKYSGNVAKDVETILCNAQYGTKEPVNKQFQAIVEEEMAATQRSLEQSETTSMTDALEQFDAAQSENLSAETANPAAEESLSSNETGGGLAAGDGGMDASIGEDGGFDGGM